MKKGAKQVSSDKLSAEAIKKNDNAYRGPGMNLKSEGYNNMGQHGGEKVPAKTKKGKSTNANLGTGDYAGPGRDI